MRFTLSLVLCMIFSYLSVAQTFERSIAILDLGERNNETHDARLYSTEQMATIAGFPFIISKDIEEVTKHHLILCTSQLKSGILNDEEKSAISSYVESGGIILAPRVTDEDLFDLFGISSYDKSNTLYRIEFDQSLDTPIFEYINEEEEWTISLGKPTIGEIYNSYFYETDSATPLAYYENDEVAISVNNYGAGKAYAFGVPWKDVILRNQINRDYEAQRVSSNDFEPTQDVYFLLLRSIFTEHVPYATWKHTSLANSTSTLMVTHDIDSKTGVDSLSTFSDSEKAMGFQATYNITTRYFKDELMSDFYNASYDVISGVLEDDHILGSHSVGHFRDFDSDDNFPMGDINIEYDEYTPYHDGTGTDAGSVFGECKVSREILDTDHDRLVRTFRAGHLLFNRYLVNVLDSLGYQYNSTFNSCDVLTAFPYKQKMNRSFGGRRSNILEMPVNISDVFHSSPISQSNYLMKAQQWLTVTEKLNANGAPIVLLIHPNRGYKLIGQEYYINRIPETVAIEEMGRFGDYWNNRSAFDFTSTLNSDVLQLTVHKDDLELDENISLIIRNGQDLKAIIIYDNEGNEVEFLQQNWGENDILIYSYDRLAVTLQDYQRELDVKIFPNPSKDHINIEIDLAKASNVNIQLHDTAGRQIFQTFEETGSAGLKFITIDLARYHLVTGLYFLSIDGGINGRTIRRIGVH